MADADPASTLAAIRERQALASDASLGFSRMEERHAALIKVAYEDVPPLLAAVEAALKLTEPTGEVHRDLDGNEERGIVRVVRCDVLRATIAAELGGKEAGDG